MNRNAEGVLLALNLELMRAAVARGHGEEAQRLADKHKVPNAFRLDLGVELSDDPTKAPEVRIG